MTEPLTGDLGMDAAREHMGRVGMPDVEAYPRQAGLADQGDPFVRDPGRLHHPTVGMGADEMVVG